MKYPEYILKYLRLRAGMDEGDTSLDAHFNNMKKDVVFEEVLRWQGIIGWGTQIRGWVEGIYGINLSDNHYSSPPEGEEDTHEMP